MPVYGSDKIFMFSRAWDYGDGILYTDSYLEFFCEFVRA